MANYFRITAYYPKADIGFIADSNGKFEQLWQFSSYLVNKGLTIIKVSKVDKFKDGNFPKADVDPTCIIIRACAKGKPIINGNTIEVSGRNYIILN